MNSCVMNVCDPPWPYRCMTSPGFRPGFSTGGKIVQGTAEIWTLRNEGNSWVHPIHSHFEEFIILEVNGKPIDKDDVLNSRKDVVSLGPGMEVKFYSRWRDFLGKHVMHCHNVVHEDHAMMIRWDIVPPGEGD